MFLRVFLLIIVTALPARASQTANLLELIGFDSAVESFVTALQSPADQLSGGDPSMAVAWELAAEELFPKEDVLEEVVTMIDGAMKAHDIERAIGFFNTRLGKLVTQMEVEAQTGFDPQLVDAEGTRILENLIENDPARLELYTEMLDALSAVDIGVASAMNMNVAIYSGMSRSGQMQFQLSDAEILELVSSQHDQLRATIQQSVYVNTAFTYRDLSDADLRAYTDFLISEAGQGLYGAIHRATEDVYGRRAEQFGKRLMELQGVKEL